jgi:hypothetical protein
MTMVRRDDAAIGHLNNFTLFAHIIVPFVNWDYEKRVIPVGS